LSEDPTIRKFITTQEALALLVADDYVGDAPLRTRMVLGRIREAL
jgi:hypothetical protein